jgi:hypothetical protein
VPTITKLKYLTALKEQLAAGATIEELNAPTKAGEQVGTVSAERAVASLSASTLAGLQDAALSDAPSAAAAKATRNAAIAWGEQLNTVGAIALTEGSAGRAIVDTLVAGGIMTEAERAGLVALATQDVRGPSWAETAGLGFVYPENLEQAQEVSG